MFKYLLLAAFLPAIFAQRVSHTACTLPHGSNPPDVAEWVEVEGCDPSGCTVEAGAPVHLRAAFTPHTSHELVRFRVHAHLAFIPLPIPQPDGLDEGCNFIVDGCPIVAGAGQRIADMLFQQEGTSIIAGQTVTISVDVMDYHSNHIIACASVLVTITHPTNK